jgi:hypothetical protein
MPIIKTIHQIYTSNKIDSYQCMTLVYHSESGFEQELKSIDLKESTNFYEKYLNISDQELQKEFYKYVILYYHGGIFLSKPSDTNIQEAIYRIEQIIIYCEFRKISLFQCPDVIVADMLHHPQLFFMLSEEKFHPLLLYSLTKNVPKTLVTSLSSTQYAIDIIENENRKKDEFIGKEPNGREPNGKEPNGKEPNGQKSLWIKLFNSLIIGTISGIIGGFIGGIYYRKIDPVQR